MVRRLPRRRKLGPGGDLRSLPPQCSGLGLGSREQCRLPVLPTFPIQVLSAAALRPASRVTLGLTSSAAAVDACGTTRVRRCTAPTLFSHHQPTAATDASHTDSCWCLVPAMRVPTSLAYCRSGHRTASRIADGGVGWVHSGHAQRRCSVGGAGGFRWFWTVSTM